MSARWNSRLTLTLASLSAVLTRHGSLLETRMGNLLYWAVVFLIIALIAAAFGFGGLAGVAMSGAQLLFWVAIILFVISVVAEVFRRRT